MKRRQHDKYLNRTDETTIVAARLKWSKAHEDSTTPDPFRTNAFFVHRKVMGASRNP